MSFNTADLLRECLLSLSGLGAIVVDNASADGSPDLVQEQFPGVRLVRNAENRGFGAACNQGLALVETPYVLLLNSDAELRPGALSTLLGSLEADPGVAAVGPRILGAAGPELSVGAGPGLLADLRQRGLVRHAEAGTAPGVISDLTRTRSEPVWVSAACLLARTEALLSVGGFDESFFLYCEDVDLCLRIRDQGYRVLFEPLAEVAHRRGGSTAAFPKARIEYHRSHLRLYRKHLSLPSVLALRGWLLFRGLLSALSGNPTLGRELEKVALFGP